MPSSHGASCRGRAGAKNVAGNLTATHEDSTPSWCHLAPENPPRRARGALPYPPGARGPTRRAVGRLRAGPGPGRRSSPSTFLRRHRRWNSWAGGRAGAGSCPRAAWGLALRSLKRAVHGVKNPGGTHHLLGANTAEGGRPRTRPQPHVRPGKAQGTGTQTGPSARLRAEPRARPAVCGRECTEHSAGYALPGPRSFQGPSTPGAAVRGHVTGESVCHRPAPSSAGPETRGA